MPSRNNTQHRVILVPEIPPEDARNNPLLKPYKQGLPDFGKVTQENCYYGLGKVLLEFESAVCQLEQSIEDGEQDLSAMLARLEPAKLQLETVWNSVQILHITTDGLDKDRFVTLHRRAERAFLTRLDSRVIYDFLTNVTATGEEERILERWLVEYKHQGYELTEKKQLELNSNWMKRLGEAQRDHRFKLDAATQRFRSVVRDPAVVREFPEDLLRAMSLDSSQPAKGPWSVTLHPYIHRKFMEYCPDRMLRWNLYLADIGRGSRQMDVYLNVMVHIRDIRQFKLDQAITLGYENHAAMSMETKMAGSVENVHSMIAAMHGPAREAQEAEISRLQDYAESRGLEDSINTYDVPFYARKERRTLLGIQDEAVREFFPLPHVLETIFGLMSEHYGVRLEVESNPSTSTWHKDVVTYRVLGEGDKILGHTYLDPYIRDDKAYEGGDKGWYIPVRNHSSVGECLPLGAIILALSPPGYGKPSLLSLPEVETLMRTTAKMVQHMLSANQYSELSGTSGVEWDALNVVPDFMSHWLYVPHVMTAMSSQWSTGEKMPASLLDSLVASRHHMAGYNLSKELFLAAFDIAFYSVDYDSEKFMDLGDRLAGQYMVLDKDKDDAFPMYFDEMMTGKLSAGYYSHVWSRMLAADAFSAYLEVGWENKEAVENISKRFRETFLSSGSKVAAAQVFRSFRGRDPTPEALLISLGLEGSRVPKKRGERVN